MSLIAPLRKDHPALSSRGLPAPVFPTVPPRPRCPRCHKTLTVDGGEAAAWVCPECDYREPAGAYAMPRTAARRVLAAQRAARGVEIPMVYTAAPFPDLDWSDDEPIPRPYQHERVGTYIVTSWCQRCQQPGQSYTACRCVLMPDRYVRHGGPDA